MGRVRGMGGSGGGVQNKRAGGRFGSSECYILDPLLLPRLEQYSHNNELSNVEVTMDYLRTNYREYRRKQQGPFRKLIVRAVQILKKRLREDGGDSEEDEWEDFSPAIARRDGGDEKLQAMEERHLMRSGALRQTDELEAESLDNSSENSDGVESEGMSEGSAGARDGRGGQLVASTSRGKRKVREASVAPAAMSDRRRGPGSSGKRFRLQREDKGTSGSEEELAFDGMDEEKPKVNLLNSSLRTTYSGRPRLVIESCSVADENPRPAFAPASVVADAARAALSGKRSRNGPVVDVEARDAHGNGSASVAITERDLYRGSPRMQGSGRIPQGFRFKGQAPAPSCSAPEGVLRGQADLKRASDARDPELPTMLERVESGVGNYEGSEKVSASSQEREILRPNGKMRKSTRGRVNDAEDGAAVADRGGSSMSSTPQNVSFKDLGGIEETLEVIREIIEYPLAHPELYDHLGVQPPRGILLHGPPGCGKTMLANAIAVETRVPFLKISAPEVVSGMSGESEAKVRALFAEAVRLAPCIVFIDEIDAITPKRETAQREMERRIVAQLLTCMDDLNQPMGENSVTLPKQRLRHVVVIGATNRPDALDPALRRAGRFDREIALGIPDEKARARILSVLSQNLRLDGSFDFNHIAKRTPGFVGADLAALTTEAAAVAVKRIFLTKHPRLMSSARSDSKRTLPSTTHRADGGKLSDLRKRDDVAAEQCEELSTVGVLKETDSPESASFSMEIERDERVEEHWRRPWTRDELESLSINMQDFEDAVVKVQPSAKREGFATIPDVTWDDVGSLGSVREELEFSISRPIKHPEEYQAMGLEMATGVLLFGPPGCGKTLVAKAIANDAGANFISIKGPELLNKYVGESERAVRQLFTRARASAPCVLFFDEMDAMAPKRGNDGNAAAERVVNQLLTALDGLESRKSVFIIAATNRPDMIDPALMRPGRLDKLLYVPLPDPQGRGSILRTLVRKVPLTGDVNVTVIGESARCDGFSGADLASLIREACIASMRERIARLSNGEDHRSTEDGRVGVSPNHFNIAFSRVSPSVSTKDRLRYDMLCERIRYARSSIRSSQQETDAAARPVAAAC